MSRQHRGVRRRWNTLLAAALATLMATTAGSLPRAGAAVDERELRAREAFAVGRYQDALDIFAKLYAEKLHPNYLRNIGRCYQNLGDPDKAITSFKDYLRTAKAVSPAERQEVEGYIKEMQDLKAQRDSSRAVDPARGGGDAPTGGSPGAGAGGGAATTGPSSTTGTTGTTGTTTTTTTTLPGTGSGTTALPQASNTTGGTMEPQGSQLTGGPTTPSHEGSHDGSQAPVYQRWWFWLIVGGVAAAGLGTAAALGAFTSTEDARCPEGTRC